MKKRTRGIALVMVMMALGLLAVTTLGITYLGNMSLVQSKNQFQTDEAIFAAQAGLRVKVSQLRDGDESNICLLYTSPSPRDRQKSRMPSSA